MISNYAVLKDDVVVNIIVADENYSFGDLDVIKYGDKTFCEPGMIYKASDNSFHSDQNPSVDAKD